MQRPEQGGSLESLAEACDTYFSSSWWRGADNQWDRDLGKSSNSQHKRRHEDADDQLERVPRIVMNYTFTNKDDYADDNLDLQKNPVLVMADEEQEVMTSWAVG